MSVLNCNIIKAGPKAAAGVLSSDDNISNLTLIYFSYENDHKDDTSLEELQ